MSKATPREVSPPPIEQPDVLVRFLKHGLLECGDLAVPGECRTLPAAEAAIHIGAHRAVLGGVRCRALESHCADRTWREAGAEFDLPTELAVSLHRYGRLAVMDPSSLPAKITLPDVLPRPVRTPPVDPWASIPRVPVKVLRPFAAAGEAFAPGTVAAVPENIAVLAVKAQAAEFTGIDKLTDQARRFFQSLSNPNPNAPAATY